MTATDDTTPTIADVDRLVAWMDAEGLGTGAPLEHRYISGGSQNEIYELRRGDLHAAMRIPPPSRTGGAGRRHRPRVADHRGAERDGRAPHRGHRRLHGPGGARAAPSTSWASSTAGRPWARRRQWPAPFDTDLEARQGLAFQLVEGIALLSKVDWKAKGLEDLGRPDGFHERQVDRWTAFLERIKGRELPGFDEASAWLRAAPADRLHPRASCTATTSSPTSCSRHGAPARLAAIVDWEMGTVGDPKLDLGWVVQRLAGGHQRRRGQRRRLRRHDGHAVARPRCSTHYAEESGRQVDDIDYYCVLAKWKLAVVLEQGYQRAGDDAKLQAFGPVVLDLMAAAAELAETSDYKG